MAAFTFITAGESHGPMLTVIVSGMPAGVKLDRARIDGELARRQRGYGRGGRMKIESDAAEVTAGVRGGETLGSPVAIVIRNADFETWRPVMDPWTIDPAETEKRRVHSPRPGHADLAGGLKLDRHDLRDILERASARETAARVAAGALAKELLAAFGISVASAVVSVGGAGDPDATPEWKDLETARDPDFNAWPADSGDAMRAEIDAAREAGDTVGGTIVAIAHGVPPGLGSFGQWNAKLDGRIGQAILSIHAVKGVAIGAGVRAAQLRGSKVHDSIVPGERGGMSRTSNRAGGLEAGVTNGEDVVVRAFMKPISTLRAGIPSVDLDTREPARSQWERSDVAAVAACSVICEAMLAITIANAMREKFGGDSLEEMQRNWRGYLEQIAAW
ncbi:MAG: chorismate synthase [Thermoanaerobaculia bacterium]